MAFRPDNAGMGELLRSRRVAGAVQEAAEAIAGRLGEVDSHDGAVHGAIWADTLDDLRIPRAAARITLASEDGRPFPGGLAMEAKHGYLSRAAGGAE